MRVQITDIHPDDGYFRNRDCLIGQTGRLETIMEWEDDWVGGEFILDIPIVDWSEGDDLTQTYFYHIRVREL